jgi:ABC-type transport system involved in multi-copper enzyme maturation permease subunit
VKELVKFELYKIFKQRTVYITLFLLVLFSTGFTFNHSTEMERQMYKDWEGPITKEKAELAEKEYQNLMRIMDQRAEDQGHQGGHMFTDKEETQAGIYETIAFIKGSEQRLKSRYKEIREDNKYNTKLEKSMIQKVDLSYFSYNKGPRETVDYASTYALLITGAMLLIGLSTTYTKEYSSRVDRYILSSSKGRESLLWSKIMAAFIYASSIVLITEIFNLIWNGIRYGYDGWMSPIQNMHTYFFSNYSFTLIEFHFIQLGFHLLAAFSFALVIILVSSLCKNSFISFIINGVIFALPYWFVESMNLPIWLSDVFSFSFLYIMKVEFLFHHFNTINLFGMPVLYPFIALVWVLVVSLIAVLVSSRVMKNKEVTI